MPGRFEFLSLTVPGKPMKIYELTSTLIIDYLYICCVYSKHVYTYSPNK